MSFGLALTLGGTATYHMLTGRPVLPRRSIFARLGLARLVADGVSFARGGFRLSAPGGDAGGSRRSAPTAAATLVADIGDEGAHAAVAASAVAAAPSRCVERGQAGPLHHAATVGDVWKLQSLLAARMEETFDRAIAPLHPIDTGDQRRFTAFHVACASGHA